MGGVEWAEIYRNRQVSIFPKWFIDQCIVSLLAGIGKELAIYFGARSSKY